MSLHLSYTMSLLFHLVCRLHHRHHYNLKHFLGYYLAPKHAKGSTSVPPHESRLYLFRYLMFQLNQGSYVKSRFHYSLHYRTSVRLPE